MLNYSKTRETRRSFIVTITEKERVRLQAGFTTINSDLAAQADCLQNRDRLALHVYFTCLRTCACVHLLCIKNVHVQVSRGLCSLLPGID